MFFKKREAPPLAIFELEYSYSAISSWVNNKTEISPDHNWDSDNDVTRGYKITMLPMDPFLFYHNDVNEFSPSITGGQTLEGKDFYSIDWEWKLEIFGVWINEGEMIFAVPMDEILYYLRNREMIPISSNVPFDKLDGGILELPTNKSYCQKIYKEETLGPGVSFKNSLVKLSIVCVGASNIVLY